MTTTQDDLCYETSQWQKILYGIERDEQPKLVELEAEGEKRAPRYGDFQRELFARLYNPLTPALEEPSEGADWARELHGVAEQLSEFGALAERTRGDEMWSAMATAAISKSIAATMKPQKGNQDLEKLRNKIDSLKQLAKSGVKVGQRLKKAEAKLQRAEEQAKALAKGLDPSQLRIAIREACDKAQQEISDADQLVSAFSYGDQPGTPISKQNMADKRRLAELLKSNHKLQRIAKAAGRLRVVAAEKQRSKTNYARDEVTSVEQGNDVDRLLPSEWALLGSDDETLELLGYARVVERKAMQYKLTGRKPLGRGPIVFCIDGSDSMSYGDGDREIYAKASAMACLEVAQRQKRSWHCVHYAQSVTRVDTVHAGKVESGALMDSMSHFPGGGTSFEAPLRKAIELIRADGEFSKADIIFITDGVCKTSARFNEWFAQQVEELGVQVFTVLVNVVEAGDTVAQWSDHIFSLEDILDGGSEAREFEDVVFSI